MTNEETTSTADLGATLDRIYKAVRGTFEVTTDGFPYHPFKETERLAAELGFVQQTKPGTYDSAFYGTFQPDQAHAEWKRNYHFEVLLRVLLRAGAARGDVEVLRDALGIEVDDRLDDVITKTDAHNEQARQYWMDQAIASHGHAVGFARDKARKDAIQEAFELTGDERLLHMEFGGGNTLALERRPPLRAKAS